MKKLHKHGFLYESITVNWPVEFVNSHTIELTYKTLIIICCIAELAYYVDGKCAYIKVYTMAQYLCMRKYIYMLNAFINVYIYYRDCHTMTYGSLFIPASNSHTIKLWYHNFTCELTTCIRSVDFI